MTTALLVKELKQNQEDFEFYPTTAEMIEAIKNDLDTAEIGSRITLFEIGAGDCRVNQAIADHLDAKSVRVDILAIEKAITHIKNFPRNVKFVGADFFETNLVAIKSSMVFCNPPYSEYECWMERILTQTNASVTYFVVPQRWQNNDAIKQALSESKMTAKVIFEGDFLEADRKARAKVQVVRVYKAQGLPKGQKFYIGSATSADVKSTLFDGFDEAKEINESHFDEAQELIATGGCIDSMVAFYNKDMDSLFESYNAMAKMDARVIKLLNVSKHTAIEAIKQEIKNLKNAYWSEFLNRYEPITRRLTKDSRKKLYEQVLDNAKEIDFTAKNCYAITMLVIDRANEYVDTQIKDLFVKHANSDNLKAYKSNQRVFEKGDYRYCHPFANDEIIKHYECSKLEYRLVCNWYMSRHSWEVSAAMYDVINDYRVVARSLGLGGCLVLNSQDDLSIGKKLVVKRMDFNVPQDENLFDITFYKKGTYHIRPSQEFALRLNIAIGKLFGWLHSAEQASHELDVDIEQVAPIFEKSNKIMFEQSTELLGIGFDGEAA
ncbi:hypothetical protein B0181_07905 [Moraxella caviae]|uniref:DUF4942 domain-containing protein n=1 Tax=Moraxella caviae TaxID=34060 RepID=A0A1T0A0A6_9GAMM|nr:DUF4942 domain-containing protein [Moraxella caviae]OOR88631.1 hypothetical protein B0181_07905 [Moraxella caviae]STZ13686.1 Uncharacterised protein [Moraxella caviae]